MIQYKMVEMVEMVEMEGRVEMVETAKIEVSRSLRDEVKAYALLEHKSLRRVVTELLQRYISVHNSSHNEYDKFDKGVDKDGYTFE